MPVCARVWVLVDRSALCRRHDMRVRVCNWITARYRVTCVLVGWWITTASHGVKRDVGHVSGGVKSTCACGGVKYRKYVKS